MPNPNPDQLYFKRTDYSTRQEIVDIAKEFADYFNSNSTLVPEFCSLIKTSRRWNMLNLKTKLSEYLIHFRRIGSHTKRISELIERSFLLCESDKDISDLRGILVESLIIGKHGGTSILSNQQYGWGAKVFIKGERDPIRYICRETCPPFQNCKNRYTVDFGVWNGYIGRFYECKAQPAGIGCSEMNYMNNLSNELKSRNH